MSIENNNSWTRTFLTHINESVMSSTWEKKSLLGQKEKWQIQNGNQPNIINIQHIKLSPFQNFIKSLNEFFSLNFDVKVDVCTKSIRLDKTFNEVDKNELSILLNEIQDESIKNYIKTIIKTDAITHDILNNDSSSHENKEIQNNVEDLNKDKHDDFESTSRNKFKNEFTEIARKKEKNPIELRDKSELEIHKNSQEAIHDRPTTEWRIISCARQAFFLTSSLPASASSWMKKKFMWEESPQARFTPSFESPEIEHTQIIESYKREAENGDMIAQYNLGCLYEYTLNNDEEAAKYYKLAADKGDVQAQYHLGLLYHLGTNIEKNDEEAIRYYTLAADQQHAISQFNLGTMYEKGRGVTQDTIRAFRYYKLAADQHYKLAQFMLGCIYEEGKWVEKDEKEAFRYYKLAADQGDQKAKHHLQRLEGLAGLEEVNL